MVKLKILRSLLAVLALGLAADQAHAVTLHPGSPSPQAAIGSRLIPAGYRNVSHCGLVRIADAPAAPRHRLRNPYLYQAPFESRGLAALQARSQDLKQRPATGRQAWGLEPLGLSSRPLRAYRRRLSTGCSRHWSIRPPPTQSL